MANLGYVENLENLQDKFKTFVFEATAGVKNQAAALRARKLSMELRDVLKDFRTASVENDKKMRDAKTSE